MLLLKADNFPVGALYRIGVGFMVLPVLSLLGGTTSSASTLVPFLLLVLLFLRVAPAVVRRIVPFSPGTLEVWAERRQIAKRFDSYQWQKLFWIGAGLAAYVVYSGQFPITPIVVSVLCLLSGLTGLARWRVLTSRPGVAGLGTNLARDLR